MTDRLLAVALALVGLPTAALIVLRVAPERLLHFLDGNATEVAP